jgi:hypothetical protein
MATNVEPTIDEILLTYNGYHVYTAIVSDDVSTSMLAVNRCKFILLLWAMQTVIIIYKLGQSQFGFLFK